MALSNGAVERYLRLLRLEREPPSLDALARLTRAHLLAVPFENVTSILRYRAHGSAIPPLEAEQLLTSWGRGLGGMLCFDAPLAFGSLLRALGYDAEPVLGFIAFPGSHQAILVNVDGHRRLVDVANGAPFYDPIPVEEPSEVRHAGLAYRFRRGDEPDTLLQERRVNGEWSTFCVYTLQPASDAACDTAYRRHHDPLESWVTSSLMLIRCRGENVYLLKDGELTRFSPSGKIVRRLDNPESYERAARAALGLPGLPVAAAIAALEETRATAM